VGPKRAETSDISIDLPDPISRLRTDALCNEYFSFSKGKLANYTYDLTNGGYNIRIVAFNNVLNRKHAVMK
jgi:hypothetical protein